LRRCREELGLAGISLHARFQGGGLDSPWVWRTVGAMGELGLVPFVHALDESTDEALWKVGQLAHKVPGVTILVLDAFATFEGTKHAGHLAEMHPNLVFDTSLSYNADFLVGYVRRFGAHRFAFGTDL